MKKLHFYGLLALALVLALGMAFTACSSGDSDSSDASAEDLVLYGMMDSKDVEAIISKSAKAAGDYELATGDHYIIRFVDDGTVISKGTIIYRFPSITFVPDDGGTGFTGYFSGEELTINDVPYGGAVYDINGSSTLAQKQGGGSVGVWTTSTTFSTWNGTTFGTVTSTSIEVSSTSPGALGTSNDQQAVEYALSTSATIPPVGGYKAGPLPIVFEDLVPNTTYYVWARAQASRVYAPGWAMQYGQQDTGQGIGLNILFPAAPYKAGTAFTINFNVTWPMEAWWDVPHNNIAVEPGDSINGNSTPIEIDGTTVNVENVFDDTYTLTVDGFDVAPDKTSWEVYDGYTFTAKKAYDASLTISAGQASANITLYKAGTRTLVFKLGDIIYSKTFEVLPEDPNTATLDLTPLKIKEAFKNDCSVKALTFSKAPVVTLLDVYENPCYYVDVAATFAPTFNGLAGAGGSQSVTFRSTSKTTVATNASGKAVFDELAFIVDYDGGTAVTGISLAMTFTDAVASKVVTQTVTWP